MPTVVFEPAADQGGETRTVVVAEGGALLDACDEISAAIPFSCRSASCGTCRIHVVEGAGELLAPADDELDVLDLFGTPAPAYRLACQVKMKPGVVTLRVRAVSDDE